MKIVCFNQEGLGYITRIPYSRAETMVVNMIGLNLYVKSVRLEREDAKEVSLPLFSALVRCYHLVDDATNRSRSAFAESSKTPDCFLIRI